MTITKLLPTQTHHPVVQSPDWLAHCSNHKDSSLFGMGEEEVKFAVMNKNNMHSLSFQGIKCLNALVF